MLPPLPLPLDLPHQSFLLPPKCHFFKKVTARLCSIIFRLRDSAVDVAVAALLLIAIVFFPFPSLLLLSSSSSLLRFRFDEATPIIRSTISVCR